ncbi:MAG: AAA family ATPase [Pyrinomonadaceae bacterium]
MHISKVELENIKSHVRSVYNFQRGTTAITGKNGAGKTSIIEAVAWALFDLLEYKKEDFVRRGAKKGIVRITFESSVDEREYVVYRDSGAGYHVTDPRLQTRIADKKEEVFRFLWQHLGLEPGTDLRVLFRQAIGVPQGTFTAIFLEGATERKTAFDRLLKVEEYRQAAENLRDTSRFIENGLIEARETIARVEGELSRSQTVADEHKSIAKRARSVTAEIKDVAAKVKEHKLRVKQLDEKERSVSNLRAAVERCVTAREKAELIASQVEQALSRSNDALAKLNAVRAAHERHVAALERLRDLEGKRSARDRVKSELAKTDAAIVNVNATRKRLEQDLEKLMAAGKKIETLRVKAIEQAAIEKEIDDLKNLAAAARTANERIESIERELERLRSKFASNRDKLISAQDNVPQKQIAELETLHSELVKSYRKRRTEIEDEGRELTEKKRSLEQRLGELESLERQIEGANTRLSKLVDPAAQIRLLEKELLREPEIREGLGNVESSLERLEAERRQFVEQLEDFANFDEEWKRVSDERDATVAAHRTFLANENEGAELEQRRAQAETAKSELAAATESVELAEREFSAAGVDYDAKLHAAERAALLDVERRSAELRATLDGIKTREAQLATEIARFGELRKTLADTFREKERLAETAETTAFIRNTLKEAAPRVARNYVYHVSIEANMLFREITGGAARTLKWGEDYGISLEEDGFERPFQSLSGGEQMAAALAVRLALLKQLSDIRIAFFDEPTTNMDEERRENFAQEVGRIKNFDQLFVISHDETFDNYVDNVVHIERSPLHSAQSAA